MVGACVPPPASPGIGTARTNTYEAHSLLQPIYGWFVEGFDTPSLKSAKALLDELGDLVNLANAIGGRVNYGSVNSAAACRSGAHPMIDQPAERRLGICSRLCQDRAVIRDPMLDSVGFEQVALVAA